MYQQATGGIKAQLDYLRENGRISPHVIPQEAGQQGGAGAWVRGAGVSKEGKLGWRCAQSCRSFKKSCASHTLSLTRLLSAMI